MFGRTVLTSTCHFFYCSIRSVPHIHQLFDEEVLIGKGWTTNESQRPLAYSALADLVHHVHTHLPLPPLSLAVHMFSKAWFPYDRPDRPSRLKTCSDDRDDRMETLPRRSQTTRTTETTSIAWIELSSIRTIGTIE